MTKKLTEKGPDYGNELLKRNRSAAHGKLLLLLHKVKGLFKDGANIEELVKANNVLDHGIESFVEAHEKYNDLLTITEDKDGAYQWFEGQNREYE